MKIALVTGSRSDRGALEMVAAALRAHDVVWYPLGPSGMPPGPCHTLDKAHAASQAADAVLTIENSFGECQQIADLIILHGDRYEILGAAMAANIMGVPIAHLGGGDVTEGSQDDGYRHAITKLAHLHFPTHEAAGRRIIQMGEPPDRVHVVGDPSVDRAMAAEAMERDETFRAVGLATPQRAALVSWHPNPLGDTDAETGALYDALDRLPADVAVIWIGPNADAGNDMVRRHGQAFAERRNDRRAGSAAYHDNLDARTYFSLMGHCDVMVGNSSAALIEAPVFGLPAVNIGDRQKGRPEPQNVVSCAPVAADILSFIRLQFEYGRAPCVNPYGDGHAAERIAEIIGRIADPRALLRKVFHDCPS